jgi:hypothetical protein
MTKTLACFAGIALSTTFIAMAGAQSPPAAGAPPQTNQTSAVAFAKGKVVGPSNEPQAGVPVQIEGPLGQTVAITDKSGTWSLYNLVPGNYKVQMLGNQKSKVPDPVDFTVKDTSFWERLSGANQMVVWTPEIRINSTTPPSH